MWKDIKGYEGLYMIDEFGDVKSLPKNLGEVKRKKSIILKPDINSLGYKRVTLCKEKKNKRFQVHRLVYENFVKEIQEGKIINHLDENKSNNHYSNLEEVSALENNYHSRKRLGYKLDLDEVAFIRNSDLTNKELSEKFNINTRHVTRVRNGKRWNPNGVIYGNPVPSLQNCRKV